MSKFIGFSCVISEDNKPRYFFHYKNSNWKEKLVKVKLLDILRAINDLLDFKTITTEAKETYNAFEKARKDYEMDVGADSVGVKNAKDN